MNATEPIFVFYQNWEDAVPWAEQQLTQAGFEPLRTFDFQVARARQPLCPCPHHGTDQCDCQMVVLLVYGKTSQPLSLVVHGHDEMTWMYIVNTPQQRADARLLALILRELTPLEPPPMVDGTALPEKTDQIDFQSASYE
jgi:hypothetical protein